MFFGELPEDSDLDVTVTMRISPVVLDRMRPYCEMYDLSPQDMVSVLTGTGLALADDAYASMGVHVTWDSLDRIFKQYVSATKRSKDNVV